jgi:predicted MFS family arabinose efflux permease
VPFLTLFGINFCLFGGMNMLLATMPIHFKDHGMTEAMIGFIFGAFFASSICSRLLTGRLAKRLGELGLLKAALLTAALGNVLMLSGDLFPVYLLTRLVNGAGVGAATTLMISLASKIIPPARLAEGLGRLALGASLALAFGPFAGIKLAESCGFPVLLATTCLLLTLAFLAASTRRSSDFLVDGAAASQAGAPVGTTGQAGVGVGEACQGGAAGQAGAGEACQAGVGAGADDPGGARSGSAAPGGDGAPFEAGAGAPASKGARLPDKELLLPSLLVLLLGGACCGIFTYLVLYLDELGIKGAAAFFFVATMGIVTTRIAGGRVHDRFGHMFVIVPSSLLIMSALLILLLFPGPAAANVAAACYGLGMGALFPSLQALTISYSPPEKRTLAAALFLNGYDVGTSLNTVAMGILAGVFHTYRSVYAATPLFMAALLLVYCLNPVFDKGRRAGFAAR